MTNSNTITLKRTAISVNYPGKCLNNTYLYGRVEATNYRCHNDATRKIPYTH